MKHIWIINQHTTTTMFYRSYSEMDIDPDLVSGLLTALNNFSEIELKSHGISSIDMGGLRWAYLNRPEKALLLIAADNLSANAEVMKARLEVIYKMFAQNYDITSEKMEDLIKVDTFQNFSSTVDMLRDQWAQAESVMGAAAMFDLLGVFQQIFNNFTQIVKYNFYGDKYEMIIQEISQFNSEMNEMKEFKDHPELESITYDESTGWSVISLNPTKMDAIILKKALFKITEHLKSVLLKHMSRMAILYAFSREILPYLLNQYELLDSLGVNRTLLALFLE